jgi:predicted RNA-binding protein with PUA-like domain
MKTEPDTFSIADLERVKVEPWSGVRSMFARFHMRAMSPGDLVLFHHSSCNPPGVAGTAKVVRTGVVDETQFDPASPYFEPKATREAPIWDCVDVEYVSTFPYLVSMDRMRADEALADMHVLRVGRLSVQPVKEHEYHRVVELGQIEPPPVEKKPRAPAPKKKPAATTAKQPASKKSTKKSTKTAKTKKTTKSKKPPKTPNTKAKKP